MSNPTNKKIRPFLIGAILIAMVIVIGIIKPDQIVDWVGPDRVYLVAFVVSLVGGVSTFTSAPFFAIIGALALGGADPLLLALSAGPGLFISDLVFYGLGSQVRHVLTGKSQQVLQKMEKFVSEQKTFLVWLLVILYTGVTPFPGDLLMLAMAGAKYPFKKFIIPLLIGNIILVLSISYAAMTGESLLQALLM